MKSNKNLSNGGLWGELPAREMIKQEVITPDLIENVWRQVMDDSNNIDCDYQNDRQSEYLQLPMGNLHVLNTINLHQQLRMMVKDLNRSLDTSLEAFMAVDTIAKKAFLEISRYKEEGTVLGNLTVIESQDAKDTSSRGLFNFLSYESERNIFKDGSTIHYLTSQTARNLLRHAVTTLLAHIGFENSSDVAIETLTDVADHFVRRMTLLLKVAAEHKDHGFPDAVERVLLETGVGGVSALHDYYQEYILKFGENTRRKVEEMMERQRQLELNACSTKMALDEAASTLQFEDLDKFGNVYREVSTLQLLDPEKGFPPSLNAGFQMLYSLEQDK